MRRRLLIVAPLAIACRLRAGPEPAGLIPPIEGLSRKNLRDSFDEAHSGGKHEAMDILAPRGTPVHAMVSGTIRKLFLSKPGGNTIYLFDDRQQFCYYYAHLEAYKPGLREGMRVIQGEELGYVGTSGNADVRTPHLHLSIMVLNDRKEWWRGAYINPYPLIVDALRKS